MLTHFKNKIAVVGTCILSIAGGRASSQLCTYWLWQRNRWICAFLRSWSTLKGWQNHWLETQHLARLFSYPFLRRGPRSESWPWLVARVPASHMCKMWSAPSLSNTCRVVKEEQSTVRQTSSSWERPKLLKSVWLKESKVKVKGRRADFQRRREEGMVILPANLQC